MNRQSKSRNKFTISSNAGKKVNPSFSLVIGSFDNTSMKIRQASHQFLTRAIINNIGI